RASAPRPGSDSTVAVNRITKTSCALSAGAYNGTRGSGVTLQVTASPIAAAPGTTAPAPMTTAPTPVTAAPTPMTSPPAPVAAFHRIILFLACRGPGSVHKTSNQGKFLGNTICRNYRGTSGFGLIRPSCVEAEMRRSDRSSGNAQDF